MSCQLRANAELGPLSSFLSFCLLTAKIFLQCARAGLSSSGVGKYRSSKKSRRNRWRSAPRNRMSHYATSKPSSYVEERTNAVAPSRCSNSLQRALRHEVTRSLDKGLA